VSAVPQNVREGRARSVDVQAVAEGGGHRSVACELREL
jgi:hypothetical protein